MLSKLALCIICMSFFCITNALAQKSDSVKFTLRPKSKSGTTTIPQIKANYTPSKIAGISTFNTSSVNPPTKNGKILTVFKVYPNPVSEQININLKLERETTLSIKLTDLLGNEVISLFNEKIGAGEYTKTYIIPTKLNAGIYFLRIVGGGEPVVKRISVL